LDAQHARDAQLEVGSADSYFACYVILCIATIFLNKESYFFKIFLAPIYHSLYKQQFEASITTLLQKRTRSALQSPSGITPVMPVTSKKKVLSCASSPISVGTDEENWLLSRWMNLRFVASPMSVGMEEDNALPERIKESFR